MGLQTHSDTGMVGYSLYNLVANYIGLVTPGGGEVTMDSVEDRVKKIVIELLGIENEERVVPVARFREDLEADSLDLVELIMAFEEEFGGEITDEDAQKITTVGEAVEYINENMSGN